MAFRFRLATLLRYRQLLEERAQVELAAATLALTQESRKLAALKDGHRRLQAELRQEQQAAFTAETARLYDLALRRMAGRVLAQQEQVTRREGLVKASMEGLLEASTRKKVIAGLEERARERYRRAEARAEQRALDETALARHRRA